MTHNLISQFKVRDEAGVIHEAFEYEEMRRGIPCMLSLEDEKGRPVSALSTTEYLLREHGICTLVSGAPTQDHTYRPSDS